MPPFIEILLRASQVGATDDGSSRHPWSYLSTGLRHSFKVDLPALVRSRDKYSSFSWMVVLRRSMSYLSATQLHGANAPRSYYSRTLLESARWGGCSGRNTRTSPSMLKRLPLAVKLGKIAKCGWSSSKLPPNSGHTSIFLLW
jgi:hypothetical protein